MLVIDKIIITSKNKSVFSNLKNLYIMLTLTFEVISVSVKPLKGRYSSVGRNTGDPFPV